MTKKMLFGKTIDELKEIVKQLDLPLFAAGQIAEWLYHKRVCSIDEITNLSKKARDLLSEKYDMGISVPIKEQISKDGTKKYLFPVNDGHFVESVFIPEINRKTLCISSQSGCKYNCAFCMTGKHGFHTQLSAGEIVNQIRCIPESENLTNVVFMGMGEPLDNFDEVLKSIKIMTSEWGFGWSPRRINLSTIGIIPILKQIIENSDVHIAISMNSPFHDERKMIMPIEEKYPIAQIVDTLRQYDFGKQRRISFEYIMFNNLNDTEKHIKGISQLLNGLRCRINLIKYHSIPDSPLQGSSEKKREWFSEQLNKKNFITTMRRSRGEDIFAACGQLANI
ncbi:MAG: 23S rRNA (adenine(2503)-C(2))-methyltransferase RlmN [Marinilabiliaceae bacterium]|nr:23S rRNA (adenine(2503)-C(2))-methyltransferase RlmN [Marinilabiliaceae bacterium]